MGVNNLAKRSASLGPAPMTFHNGAESQRFVGQGIETVAFKANKVKQIDHELLVEGQKRIANSVRHSTPDKFKSKMESIIASDPLIAFEDDMKK